MIKSNKRGLSGVVTTILLILLIIVAIGAVWVVVGNLIEKSSEGISLDSFTIDLEIVSARINFTDGKATLRVKRNVGVGEITGIKFIVQDTLGSDIFEEKFESFSELEERTFILNLKESEFLFLTDIYKISIAPLYKGLSGETELTGAISDYVDGLNDKIDNPRDVTPDEEIRYCTSDDGCPEDTPIADTAICNPDNTQQVFESITTWSCLIEAGVCISDFGTQVKTTCTSEEYCFDGECVLNEIVCTPETVEVDCGVDGPVGDLTCSQIYKELVVGDNKLYSCVDSLCSSTTVEYTQENCTIANPEYQCVSGTCAEVPECTSDLDCEPQDFCNDLGVCELEVPLNIGIVGSIWPFNLGEYFDSSDLPKETTNGNYGNNYIIFPGSAETRCLPLIEHVYPQNPIDNAYVRMDESQTSILSGDNYEIWQRDYICST